MKNHLDKKDMYLLKTLQEKGRITNLQMSKEVGLSPAPTLERVRKLERNFIKGYHAVIDETRLGLGIKAFIQISLVRQVDNVLIKFKSDIDKIDEITECYQVTGNYDYLLKVIVKDIPAFESLIAGKLSKLEEIGQMQTVMILKETKNSKVLPIDYNNEISLNRN